MKTITLNNNVVILLDDEDFENLSQYNWYLIGSKTHKYAARGIKVGNKRVNVTMHRSITNAPKGSEVDHINGNTFDNRKCNLRVVNKSKNMRNAGLKSDSETGYKGVSRVVSKNGIVRYRVRILVLGKRKSLGWFKTLEDAAGAYNEAAIKYFGEFARLNKLVID